MTVLILSLAGAAISLVLLIIDKKQDKRKRIILTLASIGFLLFAGQQFIGYFSDKASEKIFDELNKRTKIIDTTTNRIDTTTAGIYTKVSLLQVMVSKLNNTTIEKVGIAIKFPDELEGLHAFDKGNPEAWHTYRNWLNTPVKGKRALRFNVNTNRYYNYSLIILYLMTDNNNSQFVRNKIENMWSDFPQPANHSTIMNSKPICDFVIFENANGAIIGFAEAKSFLMNLIQIENKGELLNAMNYETSDFLSYATNNLTSFHRSVSGNTLEEIGRSMISENNSKTITAFERDNFYTNLSSLFELK